MLEVIATSFEERHICNICSIRMKNLYDYLQNFKHLQNHSYTGSPVYIVCTSLHMLAGAWTYPYEPQWALHYQNFDSTILWKRAQNDWSDILCTKKGISVTYLANFIIRIRRDKKYIIILENLKLYKIIVMKIEVPVNVGRFHCAYDRCVKILF